MTEFELKLEIPSERLPAVLAAMREDAVRSRRLQARYFDTEDEALARAGIVLRLRKEGRAWVQTAKCADGGPLQRLEHNVRLAASPGAAPPDVSLARHADSPVGEAMARALEVDSLARPVALVATYETDVRRLTRRIEAGGSVIEAALDRGVVRAREAQAQLSELEFELLAGEPLDAVRVARRWAAAHGLWLNTTSKSAKGQRLLTGRPFGPPVGAAPAQLRKRDPDARIAVAVLRACLEQVLGNASEIAAGSDDAEHVHQLRVGIRRLRAALREVPRLGEGADPAWEAALVDAFRELGSHRDRHHLEQVVQPQLQAQGGPALDFGAAPPAPDPGAVVRSPAFQDALLALIEHAHRADGQTDKPAKPGGASHALNARLQKLHDQVCRDGRRFERLDAARQHRVRKRLKRLRYLAEFVAPLFPSRRCRDFIAAIKPVQDALGLYNDEWMALEAYKALAARDPAAWFGVGWLGARRAAHAAQCQRELRRFADIRPFWH